MRLNLKEKRNHNIKSDYGLNDYYKYYKSKKGHLDRATFRKIIYTFNKGLYPIICSLNYDYRLPKRMGIIYVAQKETYVDIDNNGELVTNRAINYKATLDLWEQDPKLREERFYVRYEDPYVFALKYSKFSATYKNKSIYNFAFNRELKQYLKNLIKDNPNFRAKLDIWKLNSYH